MAEQTFTFAASDFFDRPSAVDWRYTSGSRAAINADLRGQDARFLAWVQLLTNGEFRLYITSNQTEAETGTSDDLSDAFETSGSVEIIVPGHGSLLVSLAGADTTEPYLWLPSNSNEVIALYNSLNGLGDDAVGATVILRDFVPTAPSFADDTGTPIMGMVGEAIADVVVPEAVGPERTGNEQTIVAPATRFVDSNSGVLWRFPVNNYIPIVDDLKQSPADARFFASLALRPAGSVGLFIASTQTQSPGTSGQDISDAFEANGSIEIRVPGQSSLLVSLNGADIAEPYQWTPSNSSDVAALFNALHSGSAVGATIILRDFVPGRDPVAPDPTYAVVGDLPAGVSFDPDTRTISFDENNLEAGSGTIVIRTSNSEGNDDWSVAYDFEAAHEDLEVGATFQGGLVGTLSPGVALGPPPLDLDEFRATGTVYMRMRITAGSYTRGNGQENLWASDLWTADGAAGQVGVLEEGDPEITGISGNSPTLRRFARWDRGGSDQRLILNSQDDDLGDILDDSTGPFLTIVRETSAGHELRTFSAVVRGGSAFVDWRRSDANFSDDDWNFINAIAVGDDVILAIHDGVASYSLVDLGVDAAFQGGLAGTLSPDVALGDTPDLNVDAAFDGGLAGTLNPAVALGDAPDLGVDASLQGDLAGTLAPNVALGDAPNLAVDAAIQGGLAGTLAPDVRLASDAPSLEVDAALQGGLAGTLVPNVALDDTPDLGVDAALDGGLAGTLAPGVALGDAPDLRVDTALDGGLAGTLAPGVALGDAPDLSADAAFDGDLAGTLAPNVGLRGGLDLPVDAAFQGDLAGTLAAGVALGRIPLDLDLFRATGTIHMRIRVAVGSYVRGNGQENLWASNLWTNDGADGQVGTLEEGDPEISGVGETETVTRLARLDGDSDENRRFILNSTGDFDIGSLFDAADDPYRLTLVRQTETGHEIITLPTPSTREGGGFVDWRRSDSDFSQEMFDFVTALAEGGELIAVIHQGVAEYGPEGLELSAAFQGGLAGTLLPQVARPPLFVDDTGDTIAGTVGVAIADVVVPEAEGDPDPTYAVVGALPAGVAFEPSTRTLSFDEDVIEAGSGTITIRASSSAGTDDWSAAYDFQAVVEPGDVAPRFTDDTGDAITGTVGQAIADVVVPEAVRTPGNEQTLSLPESWFLYLIFSSIKRWSPPANSRPSIDAALRADGGADAFLSSLIIVATGQVILHITGAQTGSGDRVDLNANFEQAGNLRIEAGGASLSLDLTGQDTAEPYGFPASTEGNTFYNALPTSGGQAATLRIRDYDPDAAPNPAPTYSVVGDLPAGVSFDPSTRTFSFDENNLESGSGTIVVRARNRAGSDDWSVAYDFQPRPTVDVDATFQGGLVGTLSPGVALGPAQDLIVGAAFAGGLAGTLSPAVALLEDLGVDVAFQGGLAGTLAPGVALGVAPAQVGAAFVGGLDGLLAPGVRLVDVLDLPLDVAFTGDLEGTLAAAVDLGLVPASTDDVWFAAERNIAGDLAKYAMEITHPDLATPVRLVADTIDHTIEGNTYGHANFRPTPPQFATGEIPKAKIELGNVGRPLMRLFEATRGGHGASIRLMLVLYGATGSQIVWEVPALAVASAGVSNKRVDISLSGRHGRRRPGIKIRHDTRSSPGVF